MQLTSRTIIAVGIALGGVSMLYFFSLVLGFPFAIAAPLILIIAGLFVWWFEKALPSAGNEEPYLAKLPLYVLLTGIVIMISKSQTLGLTYGGWDAWTIWNYHAKFLAAGHEWRNMFSGSIDHPDYPLLVPGVNAFFLRLLAGLGQTMVPFLFSCCIMLFIPVLIFMEIRNRSIIVAAIVFLLMACDDYFLQNTLTQYADAPLAFFFLGALVCMSYAESDRKYIAIAAACLGCCMWTKNEGVILAVIFMLFNFRHFFARKNFFLMLAGIVIPVIALAVFKHFYAPSNDILNKQGIYTWHQLFMPDRYLLVWTHFTSELDQNFYYAKVMFALYLLVCVVRKKWPEKQFVMVVACILAYLIVYILSTKDLEWHLSTSLGRLLLQLMPAMMFVLAQRFAAGKLITITQRT